jgi:hypothetical protein
MVAREEWEEPVLTHQRVRVSEEREQSVAQQVPVVRAMPVALSHLM